MNPAGLPTTPAAQPGTLRAAARMGAWRTRRPVTDPNLCQMCGTCAVFCPEGAKLVRAEPGGRRWMDTDLALCKGCGICAVECPSRAIAMVEEGS